MLSVIFMPFAETGAGVEDLEEKAMESRYHWRTSTLTFSASDRERSRSSTPQLERPTSAPPINLPGKLCNTLAALSMS